MTAPPVMSEAVPEGDKQPVRGVGLDPPAGPPEQARARPTRFQSVDPEVAAKKLQPARKPVALLDNEAYHEVYDIQVVSTPDQGKRLKLNGVEIPLYIPEGYAPSLTTTDAGDFQIISVPFLVEPGTEITYIDALEG